MVTLILQIVYWVLEKIVGPVSDAIKKYSSKIKKKKKAFFKAIEDYQNQDVPDTLSEEEEAWRLMDEKKNSNK